jgi:hypothetical protein
MEVRLGNAGTFGCVSHHQLKNPSGSFALQAEPFYALVAVKQLDNIAWRGKSGNPLCYIFNIGKPTIPAPLDYICG